MRHLFALALVAAVALAACETEPVGIEVNPQLARGGVPGPPPGSGAPPGAGPPEGADPPSTITFDSNRTGDGEVWAMDGDGANQRQLTDSPGMDRISSLSPDGSQVAFISLRPGLRLNGLR